MSRFNVVLLGSKPVLKNEVSAIGRRTFASCLVLQANTVAEADLFLESLNIDVLLVDLDEHKPDILAWNLRHPHIHVLAVAKSPRSIDFPSGNTKNHFFPLQTFAESLKTELKAMKKAGELPPAPAKMKNSEGPALPADFSDYSSLMHSS